MAITRAQQVKQMLREGGRIGFRRGAKAPDFNPAEAAANVGKASTKSDFDASADRVAAATNIASMQEALGTKDSPKTENRQRLQDQRDRTIETIRDRNREARNEKIAETLGLLVPSRKNFFNRSLLIPGARKSITKQRKAYADYLRSMGVVPSEELTDTDDLFSFFENQAFQKGPTVPGRTIKSYGDFLLDEFGNPTVKYRGDIAAYKRDMGIDDRGPRDQIATSPTPTDPTDPADPNQTTDVFAGIAPRFAGSKFDFDKLRRLLAEQSAADGGRIGADEGGIMQMASAPDPMDERNMVMESIAMEEFGRPLKDLDENQIRQIEEMMMEMDIPYDAKKQTAPRMMAQEGGIMDLETGRQMYFLGKLVKKASRAIKKITKSPIGKAALLGGAIYFGQQGGFTNLLKKGLLKDTAGKFTLANLSPMKAIGLASLGSALLTPEEEKDDPNRGPDIDIANIRANPYNFLAPRFTGTMFAAEGGSAKEPVATKTMPLLDMDGKEMDLRDNGGFVPIGRMEKADDVPARLSKNEFVFTADAVRNAGDGNVDKGAEVMYNMMKNLESGGEVSEESQGLEGARKMFQTSKRLEEVL